MLMSLIETDIINFNLKVALISGSGLCSESRYMVCGIQQYVLHNTND